MEVVQVLKSVSNMSAGPTHSVGMLAKKLNSLGVSSEILTFGRPPPTEWDYGVVVKNYYSLFEKVDLFGPSTIRDIRNLGNKVKIMHGHGIWRNANLFSLFLSKQSTAKILCSPRGMFSDWSWAHNAILKRPYWHLFQKQALGRVDCFHATAYSEYEDIRKRGFDQPVAIIPNGVDIPSSDISYSKAKTIIFMSRIHKKKGLELLIDAWIKFHKDYEEWQVVIAGPLDSNYALKLKSATESKVPRISFVGQIRGADKERLLSSSSLFVLPSYSENFGIAIAEALAHGTPVITTTETPWKEVSSYNCGWWVPPIQSEIETSLLNALNLGVETLETMGNRGVSLVRDHYSWDKIAADMNLLYSWLNNSSKKPDFVITD